MLAKEIKMPKLKTKSGAKKRFSLTAKGKVRGSPAFLSHNLRKRSQKMKRQARGTMILKDCDARIVKQFIPYA
jgi:large subunit ribosomal protein L35